MFDPKITIITISYNQDKYIEDTILSIISQNYSNKEFIIIDGGSTDNTINIINKYQNNIDKYISEQDKGPADALNKGFNLATGDYVYYLNSDDLMVENALTTVVNIIRSNPNIDVLYGHGYLLFDHNKKLVPTFSHRWNVKLYGLGYISILQQSTFIKKRTYDKTSGFNIMNYDNWDGELLVDLDLSGAHFKRYNNKIGIFRFYSSSISGSNRNKNRYLETKKRIFNKIQEAKPYNNTPSLLIRIFSLVRDLKINVAKIFYMNKINKFKKQMNEV